MTTEASGEYSAELIGRLLDITARRVQQLAKEGVLPRGSRGKYPLVPVVRAYCRYLRQSNDSVSAVDPDRLKPFERKAHYQAEKEKLAVEQERGELIPRIEVEQEQARIAKIVAHGLETLPDILERDCGASGAMLVRIEQHIDAVRERMYAELTEDEDAVAAG